MEIAVREMLLNDWEQVKTIYESGIATGIATFETEAPAWEKWNMSHLKFGRWVAENADEIMGWVALSTVTDRCVYSGVAEVSVYVSPAHRGNGVGLKLMERMVDDSESHGIWTLNAAMFPENDGSIRLHEKVGFRVVGYREKIAQKNGVWKDNVIMERRSKKVGWN